MVGVGKLQEIDIPLEDLCPSRKPRVGFEKELLDVLRFARPYGFAHLSDVGCDERSCIAGHRLVRGITTRLEPGTLTAADRSADSLSKSLHVEGLDPAVGVEALLDLRTMGLARA
ncbi:hypothetical protein RPSD_21940 [Ralstonia solanacearum]|nr:hypothetical protein RPSD_21940 [Ralstonia solanacearum]